MPYDSSGQDVGHALRIRTWIVPFGRPGTVPLRIRMIWRWLIEEREVGRSLRTRGRSVVGSDSG